MVQDRYKYFRVEARDILDQLGQGVLDLEKSASPADSIAPLLRLAHTLKGAARVVKQREIADRAHALEDALALLRDGPAPAPRDRIDPVFALVDEIGELVARLQPRRSDTEGIESDPTDQPIPIFRPAMDDLDALLGGVLETHARLSALQPRLAQLQSASRVAALVAERLSLSRAAEAPRPDGRSAQDNTPSMAAELCGTLGALERNLASSLDQLDQELRQVREAAERLRLTPVAALFTLLERAVRDVATALGKRVVFDASGGEARVDSFVLNVVQGALLHIVRNAAAHGIESEDADRRAAGKPIDGRITLRVVQRGRLVSFACIDDGRGIDLDAVQRIARQKGLGPELGRSMEPDELLRVLLAGGISTSSTVTDVAGRGIGLDVVRASAERLGGTVTARTAAGRGTTVELVVPLSVASFQALVVETTGETMTIPLDAVRGGLRVTREEIIRTEQHESVFFEGAAIPLAALPATATGARSRAASLPRLSVVVIRGRTGMAAFFVARIVGTAQIVMRPLPELAPASGVVAGATLDAVGDPILVLDPNGLVAAAQQPRAETLEPEPTSKSVLVVDDSLTTRMLEQSILESAGYQVDLASSGEEALDKARRERHALFLIDVEMPGMDGFTLIERIRADPTLRDVPAILVTSRSAPEDRQRGLDVGAQAYIVKSEFDQGALLERIRMLVR